MGKGRQYTYGARACPHSLSHNLDPALKMMSGKLCVLAYSILQREISLPVPTLNDVVYRLRTVKTLLRLGQRLGVDVTTLEGIGSRYVGDPKQQMIEVINYWLSKKSSDVSWSNLSSALAKIGYHELA